MNVSEVSEQENLWQYNPFSSQLSVSEHGMGTYVQHSIIIIKHR